MYEISDRGRVRSWRDRYGTRTSPTMYKLHERPSGHLYVVIRFGIDRRVRNRAVHVLVLEAFVGPRPANMIARHVDGNAKNNHVANLAWSTKRENYDDAVRMGEVAWGERHAMHKLTEGQVRAIRRSRRTGREMAKKYRVSEAAISMARNGKTWSRTT